MGVPEPMRGYAAAYAGSLGRLAHDDPDAPAVQVLAASRGKDQILAPGRPPQRQQLTPQHRGEGDGPRAPVLAEHRDLAGVAARVEITPAQPAGLRNAQTSGVEQPHERSIAGPGVGFEQPRDVVLSHDSL